VTCFRPFRNGDPPALVDLWNRGLPDHCVVSPLSVHEFDALLMGKLPFASEGLIVAERDGRTLGFVHAGFGPVDPRGASHRLDYQMGTIAMLVTEPTLDDTELEVGMVAAAERYLRDRGATVIYAGGQNPLNPFYWGIYGGSEFAGILGRHVAFHRAVGRSGYEPAARTIVLEADLARAEFRDPRAPILRRQVRFEVVEDALSAGWWEALAIGLFRPTRVSLVDRATEQVIARATTWDIASGFGLGDGRPRCGLIELEVQSEYRRKGYGRLLLSEIFRYAREQFAELVAVQTSETNQAALGLYHSVGFEQVETATLYRLPAGPVAR
jgi:GNAT superfamily N-acetyltransferase